VCPSSAYLPVHIEHYFAVLDGHCLVIGAYPIITYITYILHIIYLLMVISKVLITSVTNSNIKPDHDLSPFSGYFSRWIWVSQYQNVCSLDFIGANWS